MMNKFITDEQITEIKKIIPVVYHENFENNDDIANSFIIDKPILDTLLILYAFYEYEYHSGYATVFYYDPLHDSYFEVHGNHCSCYGLEDQWEPEEIGSYDIFIEYIKRVNFHH